MTHRRCLLALVPSLALALLAGQAAAKDSAKGSFTNPTPGGDPFRDCVSSGQYSAAGASFQVKLKKLVLADGVTPIADGDGVACSGDEYICTLESMNNVVGMTTTVFRADAKKGQVQMKHDLCKEAGGCAPPVIVTAWDRRIRCYLPDPSFAPVYLIPLPSGCEGLALGSVAPSTTQIAEDGQSTCP